MRFLSFNRQNRSRITTYLGFIIATVALTLPPSSNAQVLMNLAPQALPTSPVGPSYSGSLDAVKQLLNSPTTGTTQSKPPQAAAPKPESSPVNPLRTNNAVPADGLCELKVFQMNEIKHHKVVRVHSGPCLMVFNAND